MNQMSKYESVRMLAKEINGDVVDFELERIAYNICYISCIRWVS